MITFKRENSGVRVHESGISGDRASEWLHGHGHVDHDDAVLRRGFPDANVLVRFHGDVREGDKLRVDAHASQLQKRRTYRRVRKRRENGECDEALRGKRRDNGAMLTVKASRMAMGAFAAMAGVDPREFESERWCVSGALRDLKQ